MIDRRGFSLALAGAAATAGFAAPTPDLAGFVASPRRSAANRARDPWRHPMASLRFWGLTPGMTVVEIEPAGGYWTEILGPYLAATGGRYVAAMPERGIPAFKARFADVATWGAIEIAPLGDAPLVAAGSADLVLTARNFHDWMWTPGEVAKLLAEFHSALKPGGTLAVEEHRADPRPMIDDAHDGYVSTAYLIGEVRKAGFTLRSRSEINANPKDDKTHPFGVWTLPPTLRDHDKGKPVPAGYDAAKYKAIGESDRMTLRFASR
jgi:predicted methyltransferase